MLTAYLIESLENSMLEYPRAVLFISQKWSKAYRNAGRFGWDADARSS